MTATQVNHGLHKPIIMYPTH